MAITEREVSMIKAISDEVKLIVDEVKGGNQQEIEIINQRINKLENEVEGLISLLGEQ
ncbi:MAG: antitermination protein NusG [Hafnia sp.]